MRDTTEDGDWLTAKPDRSVVHEGSPVVSSPWVYKVVTVSYEAGGGGTPGAVLEGYLNRLADVGWEIFSVGSWRNGPTSLECDVVARAARPES